MPLHVIQCIKSLKYPWPYGVSHRMASLSICIALVSPVKHLHLLSLDYLEGATYSVQ